VKIQNVNSINRKKTYTKHAPTHSINQQKYEQGAKPKFNLIQEVVAQLKGNNVKSVTKKIILQKCVGVRKTKKYME
jgi:hypothetical protein